MKKCIPPLLFTGFILILSCRQNSHSSKSGNILKDTTRFFPVNDFIVADIKDVETTPCFMYKIVSYKNGKRDSSIIYADEFKKLAGEFLKKDINDPAIKPFLKESVFHDLSTRSYSFTYTPANPDTGIESVIVLLNDQTNMLKNIFIHSISNNNDSTVDEELSWKPNQSFQINKLIKRKNGTASEEQVYVNWKH